MLVQTALNVSPPGGLNRTLLLCKSRNSHSVYSVLSRIKIVDKDLHVLVIEVVPLVGDALDVGSTLRN